MRRILKIENKRRVRRRGKPRFVRLALFFLRRFQLFFVLERQMGLVRICVQL